MGLEAEIEALKRQNRRLKVALASTIAVMLVAVAMVAGLSGRAAMRARAQEQRARLMAEQAREYAHAAFERAEDAAKRVEGQADAAH